MMKLAAFAACLSACVLLSSLAGCHAKNDKPYVFRTLRAAISAREDLSLLKAGLLTYPANFSAAITSKDIGVTVFAPTDKAIKKLLKFLGLTGWPAANSSAAATFISVLQYHIVPAVVFAGQIKNNSTAPTLLAGSTLTLDTKASPVSIVVRGNTSDALVLRANIRAAKSVIHIVDDVLLPILPVAPAYPSIAAAALNTSDLSSLVLALSAAKLVDTVANKDLVATVFAPTNKAFEHFLAKANVKSLDKVDLGVLTKVLKYHVVPQYRTVASFTANTRVPTLLEGATLKFTYPTFDKHVPIKHLPRQPPATVRAFGSKAKVLATVYAGKAVVHVVDRVLVPKL